MADATITIGADARQAEATLAELKAITDELFRGISIAPEKAAAAQEALIAKWREMGVTVLQANDASAQLRPTLEGMAQGGDKAAFSLRDLSKSFLGTISVVALLKANLDDLKKSLVPAGQEFRNLTESMGLSNTGAQVLTNTAEMMVNPFSIVENLTANLKLSAQELAAAFYDEASAADAATDAQRRKAGVMASVLSEQQKLVEQEQRGQESLERRTAALERQIQVEQQGGEVKKFYLDKLKAILDEYDRRGETPPQKTLELASALGVLSAEQERAAKSAEGEAAAQQKVVAQQDTLIPKLKEFTDGKRQQADATREATKALEEETRALEAQAKAAQDAAGKAQQNLADAQKRLKELADKPVLTLDETEEQAKLKGELNDLDAEAATAAEDAAQATFEYGEAQGELAESTTDAADAIGDQGKKADYAAGVMSELDAATKAYEASIQAAGDSTASTNEIVETIGENGERKFTNLTEAAGEFGDVVVKAGEDGQMVMTNLGDATARAASALPKAADGLYDVAGALDEVDRAQGEGEKEKGLAKVGADAEKLAKEYLPEILRLVKEIGEEASKVTLGGGGGGGL